MFKNESWIASAHEAKVHPDADIVSAGMANWRVVGERNSDCAAAARLK
jgi:hypothetical protein